MNGLGLSVGGPFRMVSANERNRFVASGNARRNVEITRTGQRRFELKHRRARPLDETRPHIAHENQRRLIEMLHLQ